MIDRKLKLFLWKRVLLDEILLAELFVFHVIARTKKPFTWETVKQVCRTHTSKCLINYQVSILTPTRQSSNPWGLQIDFLTLFIQPLQLSGTNAAIGGHQTGSHKQQKPILNQPPVLTSSTHPPRGRPPPSVTPESPTRHDSNGELLFSQTSSTNSPSLPEPSSVTTASVVVGLRQSLQSRHCQLPV